MLYNEKIKPILNDLENPKIELAGGSTVGMVLSITNSLIGYICNLSLGKKGYESVEEEILKIKNENEILKNENLKVIDEDSNVLDKILKTYKNRKENPKEYEKACKIGVNFCLDVTKRAAKTLELACKLEKIGNRLLASDFEICKNYAFSSVKSSIVNVKINLKSIYDETYTKNINKKYEEYYEKALKFYDGR